MPSRLPSDLDLAAAAAVAVATAAIVTVWRTSPLRPVLGLLFVAVVPGYAVVSALFPERPRFLPPKQERRMPAPGPGRRSGTDDPGFPLSERIVVSVATSISLVAVMGITLNAVSPGLDIHWIVRGLAGITIGGCAVAWIRRRYEPLARLQDAV